LSARTFVRALIVSEDGADARCRAMSGTDPGRERSREELLAEIEALRHAVLHDALTGLANRALVSDRLERAVAYARRTRQGFAVLILDLDGFKAVNDHFGHATGDALLKTTGERLAASVRESDTVARLGGDEFGMVLFGADREGGEIVARKLRVELSRAVEIGGQDVATGVSAGVAVFPDDGTDPDALLRRADDAMYADKREREAPGVLKRLGSKLRRQE
jgi:diguanylate cyclase (GGDEF)-like protein